MQITRLFIDIGHGHANKRDDAYDPGAVSDRWKEHTTVAEIAYEIQCHFDHPRIILCPDNLSLSQVIRWVNAHSKLGDYLFSLHMNSGGGTGCEVIYSYASPLIRKDHARIVSATLARRLNIRDRGPKIDIQTPNGKRGEKKGLPIVRDTTVPALLLELGFIDNPKDRVQVQKHGVGALAAAIVDLEAS